MKKKNKYQFLLKSIIGAILIMIFCQSSLLAQVGHAVSYSMPGNSWTNSHPQSAWVQIPDNYNADTAYALIIFYHGKGEGPGDGYNVATYEAGGYLNKIYQNGNSLPYFRENGWDGGAVNPVTGKYTKFLIISPQTESGNGWTQVSRAASSILYMMRTYHVDTNRIYMTGLSAGGAALVQYVDGELAEGSTKPFLPAAIVPMSEANEVPTSTQGARIVTDSIPAWCFGSLSDSHGVNTKALSDYINDAKTGYSRWTAYSGGHCCWGNFYTPSYKETIGGVSMNIYSWMLTNTRGTAPTAVLGVNAGIDQNITTSSTTLTGSATAKEGETISNYLWTVVSSQSGSSPSFGSSTSATTTVAGLTVSGVYSFSLKATQSDATTISDEVSVTVAISATPAPTVNAGTDQNITVDNTIVTGSVTAGGSETITGYAWTKVSGGSATIVNPSSISTTISGLAPGIYVFKLTATQSDNQTNSDEITVNVSISGSFTISAGADTTIDSKINTVMLRGISSSATATYVWRRLNPVTNHNEIANIISPTKLQTAVMTLPFAYNGYFDFELTATDEAEVQKDTVRVNVDFDMSNTPMSNPPIRMVTAQDIIDYPGMSTGDAVIVGANDGPSSSNPNKMNVYISGSNSSGIHLGPGSHLWILAATYNLLTLRFDSGHIEGSADNPVIITNYGGQVRCRNFEIKNPGEYVNITGKYVPGVSGDVNYQGHDGGYAFSRGTYGIWVDQHWQSIAQSSIIVGGFAQHVNISYIESGDGGFAGFHMNAGLGYDRWDDINIHDLYIHNTDGEGNYLGNTGDSTHLYHMFTNSRYYNNRVLYTGNEILQWGQQESGNIAENNVLIGGAMRWRTSFESYFQANSIQIGWKNGNNYFRNNIVRGAGDQNINAVFQQYYSQSPANNDTNYIYNNYLGDSRSFLGNYFGARKPIGASVMYIHNNYMSNYNFQGDSIYTTANNAGVNTNQIWRSLNGTIEQDSTHIVFSNNFNDGTKTAYYQSWGFYDTSGNKTITIPKPLFVNSGWADNFDWTRVEAWTDSLFHTYGDEYGSTLNTKAPAAAYYQKDDIITFQSKFYKSKINNNTGHLPMGYSDDYWTLMTWTDGMNTYDYPPDDYRLLKGTKYQLEGIGLYDVPEETGILPIIIRQFFIKHHGKTIYIDEQ